MRALTRSLPPLYFLAACLLLRCALVSEQHGNATYCALFAACTALFGLAIADRAWHRDHLRAALARLERTARPPGPHAAAVADEIAIGWQHLLESCCLRAWESAGAEHDPATCTRKDQTL